MKEKPSESNFEKTRRNNKTLGLVYLYLKELKETHRLSPEAELDLMGLTPSEGRVLILRFGLEDGNLRTLEEVAKESNIPLEYIAKIERRALSKIGIRLYHPNQRKTFLKELLDETSAEDDSDDVDSATIRDPFEFFIRTLPGRSDPEIEDDTDISFEVDFDTDDSDTDEIDKSILEDWIKEAEQFFSEQNYEEAADVLGAALRMLTAASDNEECYYDLGTHVLVLEKYINALEMSDQKQRAQSYYPELESKKEELKKQVEQIANDI